MRFLFFFSIIKTVSTMNALYFLGVCCPDTMSDERLGRFEYENTTDQAKMEALIQNVKNKEIFYDANGQFLPMCEWVGVTCDEIEPPGQGDEDGGNPAGSDVEMEDADDMFEEPPTEEVVGIRWIDQLEGGLNLEWIPPAVTDFEVNNMNVTDDCDLSRLPAELYTLTLRGVKFHKRVCLDTLPADLNALILSGGKHKGTVETALLPPSLEILNIEGNKFTGTFDFGSLPRAMLLLSIGRNAFHGTICLHNLPPFLKELSIFGNEFGGTINFAEAALENAEIEGVWIRSLDSATGSVRLYSLQSLPKNVRNVDMSANVLGEAFCAEHIPRNISFFHVIQCHFHGALNTAKLPPLLSECNMVDNQLYGSISLSSLPKKLQIFVVAKNSFEGSIDLSHLPEGLQKLSLAVNKTSGSVSLERLPQHMLWIDISENQLSGDIAIGKLPQTLVAIDLRSNVFNKELRLTILPPNLGNIKLLDSGVESVVDGDGKPVHSPALSWQGNSTIMFSNLPSSSWKWCWRVLP